MFNQPEHPQQGHSVPHTSVAPSTPPVPNQPVSHAHVSHSHAGLIIGILLSLGLIGGGAFAYFGTDLIGNKDPYDMIADAVKAQQSVETMKTSFEIEARLDPSTEIRESFVADEPSNTMFEPVTLAGSFWSNGLSGEERVSDSTLVLESGILNTELALRQIEGHTYVKISSLEIPESSIAEYYLSSIQPSLDSWIQLDTEGLNPMMFIASSESLATTFPLGKPEDFLVALSETKPITFTEQEKSPASYRVEGVVDLPQFEQFLYTLARIQGRPEIYTKAQITQIMSTVKDVNDIFVSLTFDRDSDLLIDLSLSLDGPLVIDEENLGDIAVEIAVQLSDVNREIMVDVPELDTAEPFSQVLREYELMKQRDAKRLADLKQMQTALEYYYTDHQAYPRALSGIDRLGEESLCLNAKGFQQLPGCEDAYIGIIPSDPGEGAYLYSSTGDTYTINAVLEGDVGSLKSGEIVVSPSGITQAEPLVGEDSPDAIDSDNDGLLDEQEYMIGTNPYNPDSDGDGYSDYSEVTNGYNPLGDGKMTEEQKEIQLTI